VPASLANPLSVALVEPSRHLLPRVVRARPTQPPSHPSVTPYLHTLPSHPPPAHPPVPPPVPLPSPSMMRCCRWCDLRSNSHAAALVLVLVVTRGAQMRALHMSRPPTPPRAPAPVPKPRPEPLVRWMPPPPAPSYDYVREVFIRSRVGQTGLYLPTRMAVHSLRPGGASVDGTWGDAGSSLLHNRIQYEAGCRPEFW
jgi:hypothetical protein